MIRGENHLSTFGKATEQGKVATVVAHDFDDGAAGVGFGGVTDLIDALDIGVHRGVESDRVIAASDVVVDRAWEADAVDAHLGELLGADEGAVTANDDKGFDAFGLEDVDRFLTDALLFEFW